MITISPGHWHIGTEVLHKNELMLAQKVSAAITKASGLKNEGRKRGRI